MTSILSTGTVTARWQTLDVDVHGGAAGSAPAEAVEDLLVGTVHPWMAARLADGGIDGWYPIRSAAAEPVLRLRLRGAADEQDRTVHLAAQLSARVEDALGATGGSSGGSAFQPDPEPFGGPAGLAVCEQAQADVAANAVATMTTHRSRARRLHAAADLLLASAWSMGTDWNGTVRWLRGFAGSLTAPTDGAADLIRARGDAETSYARNEAGWLAQADRVREAIRNPNSVAGRWYRQQAKAWAALAEHAEAGRLSRAPATVFRELAHAQLRGQLGLGIADETYLAWIVSLPLVLTRPCEPFFTDTAASVDRVMHEHTKYFAPHFDDQMPDQSLGQLQGREEFWRPLRTVELIRPAGVDEQAARFEDVLVARRSTHGSYHGPLTLDELSKLLYYAAGVTADKALPGSGASYPVRTHPSGGGRYPVRLLLYCHDVDGLERGTYLYDPQAHAVGQLSDRDISAELLQTSPWTRPGAAPPKATGHLDAAACPLWIFPIADLTYQRMAYGLRSYRLVLMECGHIAQNISLVATWLGKSCIGISGYLDDAVHQLLNVDGVNTAVMYVYLVGDVPPAG